MDKLRYIKLENEDGSYSDSIPISVDSNYVDINGMSLADKIETLATKSEVQALASGSPAGVYGTVSALTTADPDHSKIYIVAENGHWYYYNENSWTDGGVYQAAEDSSTINNISHVTPKMVKFLDNNSIYIDIVGEYINISTKNNNSVFLITEYTARSVAATNFNTSFSLSTHNINSGIWVLIINAQNHLDLISISNNARVLNYDDIVLCIIRPSNNVYSLVKNNLYFNGSSIGLERNFLIPIYSNKDINITNDTVNKTFRIKTTALMTVCHGEGFNVISATDTTVSYNITLDGASNLIALVYNNSENPKFRIIQLFPPATTYVTCAKETYTKKNGDILFFAYNVVGQTIFPYLDHFYYNGELISKDKLETQVNELDESVDGLNTQVNELDEQVSELDEKVDELDEKVKLIDGINSYDFLRGFKNFTFIGDSLTCGFVNMDGHAINKDTAAANGTSWPAYLCNRLNKTFTNLAVGGTETHDWRYGDKTGYEDANIENANITTGIYFLCLGVNDLRRGRTVGSSADINSSDYTQNADSVYGNYDYLINKMKIFNPHAKIFVFTIPNNESSDPTNINNAIKYIANLYENVFCIDLYNLYDSTTGFLADNWNGHFDPLAYNYVSVLIETAVNNYIFEHSEYFKFVPYSYQ